MISNLQAQGEKREQVWFDRLEKTHGEVRTAWERMADNEAKVICNNTEALNELRSEISASRDFESVISDNLASIKDELHEHRANTEGKQHSQESV